ncbi:hypothetical protein C6P42_002709 [Pichia californica]|nr:hypothetical protein C6P42_002709 [[Candida] californica]
MDNIATGLASAASTVQSSIIKPRFRNEDTMFSTMNMYDDEDIFLQLTSSVKYSLPGSNQTLFMNSNYYQSLYYILLRYILLLWFTIFKYYLWCEIEIIELFSNLNSLIWKLFTYLPFPEDVSTVGPASIQSAFAVQSISTNSTLTSKAYNAFDKLKLLPTKIGNLILERSLMTSVPRSRLQIRQATGRLYIPEHIVFIFELNPLVVPQPPETPVPYLDYEKRIIVPDKKEVAKILAQRAEWTSIHHTHKASETFRVIYESAKCISWAACAGVKFITVFESNGYAWKDMPLILDIVKEEINNLSSENYQISDSIKLINLDTGEVIDASEKQDGIKHQHEFEEDHFENPESLDKTFHNITNIENIKSSISELDPIPESIITNNSTGFETMKLDSADIFHIFRIELTIFFMSNKTTNVEKFRCLKAKERIFNKVDNLDSDPKSLLSCDPEIIHYPLNPNYTQRYVEPELLFKFCNSTQMPYSLSGYPLMPSPTPSVFLSDPRPANFPFFMRGLVKVNSVMRAHAKITRHVSENAPATNLGSSDFNDL